MLYQTTKSRENVTYAYNYKIINFKSQYLLSKREEKSPLEIGDRIKLIRDITKITQSQMGNILGISHVQVGHIEKMRNRLTMDSLIKICEHFDISADFILFGKNQSETIEKLIKKRQQK